MKKIAFEDIRKGMHLAVKTDNFPDGGVGYLRSGVAHRRDYAGDWRTEDGGPLTYFGEDGVFEEYFLLESPKPPEEPGSIIANVVLKDGAELPLVFRLSDVWVGTRKDCPSRTFTTEDIVAFDLAKVEVV